LVTRLDLTETSSCTPFLTRLSCGLLIRRGPDDNRGRSVPTHGAASPASPTGLHDMAGEMWSRGCEAASRADFDDVTRQLPAGRHVHSRGSPDDQEAGCAPRRTRVPPGWPISVPVVRTCLDSPSLRTTSVSMVIEVEGLTKRHRDKAPRWSRRWRCRARRKTRSGCIRSDNADPRSLVIGGEEMTCSQSTRST
jgi:hypothetical protein